MLWVSSRQGHGIFVGLRLGWLFTAVAQYEIRSSNDLYPNQPLSNGGYNAV